MAKTEVYSWRLAPTLKAALEEAARERDESVAALLEEIAEEWLNRSSSLGSDQDGEHQRRLHEAARRCFGSVGGGDPGRAEEARQRLRQKLRRRHAG